MTGAACATTEPHRCLRWQDLPETRWGAVALEAAEAPVVRAESGILVLDTAAWIAVCGALGMAQRDAVLAARFVQAALGEVSDGE